MAEIDQLPGFRRRFRVTPQPGCVQSAVEDDYHCMAVTVHHDGSVATEIKAEMIRAPWTTCPGAVEVIQLAFTGSALADFEKRRDKAEHCTHLFDLALLAGAHAADKAPLVYDILVSDPVDGVRQAELRRDGQQLMAWTETAFHISQPAEIAGIRLDKLGPWINSLEPVMQEAARLLRWGNMLANGRSIPLERQSDASRMPASCYTFQPQRAVRAKRVGLIRDFSNGTVQLLGDIRHA